MIVPCFLLTKENSLLNMKWLRRYQLKEVMHHQKEGNSVYAKIYVQIQTLRVY